MKFKKKSKPSVSHNLSNVLGRGKGKCPKIFDHSASAIVRWMGAHNWSFDDAWIAMLTLNCGHLSETAVRNGLKFGRLSSNGKKRYGYIPELTSYQCSKLKQATL